VDLTKAYLEQELQSVRNQGAQARANISALEEQLTRQRSDVEQIRGAEKALLMMLQRLDQTPPEAKAANENDRRIEVDESAPTHSRGLSNGAAAEEIVS
jgi:hypothetical protein